MPGAAGRRLFADRRRNGRRDAAFAEEARVGDIAGRDRIDRGAARPSSRASATVNPDAGLRRRVRRATRQQAAGARRDRTDVDDPRGARPNAAAQPWSSRTGFSGSRRARRPTRARPRLPPYPRRRGRSPALLTSTSMQGHCATIAATAASASHRTLRSAARPIATPPRRATAASSRAASRPTIATRYPSATSRRAIAKPIPPRPARDDCRSLLFDPCHDLPSRMSTVDDKAILGSTV